MKYICIALISISVSVVANAQIKFVKDTPLNESINLQQLAVQNIYYSFNIIPEEEDCSVGFFGCLQNPNVMIK